MRNTNRVFLGLGMALALGGGVACTQGSTDRTSSINPGQPDPTGGMTGQAGTTGTSFNPNNPFGIPVGPATGVAGTGSISEPPIPQTMCVDGKPAGGFAGTGGMGFVVAAVDGHAQREPRSRHQRRHAAGAGGRQDGSGLRPQS